MREIVKEQDVYKRERLVNLRILPYVFSKIWFAALLSLYIAAVYVIVHYIFFDMPGGYTEFGVIFVSLFLVTMAGMMLGLFSSALAPNANSAPLIVILLMLPQIVLGGALVPLPEIITAPISTRWAFQAFMAVTGSGSDVAADACWDLPDEDREILMAPSTSLEEKDAKCNCMGTNALRAETCNFPGLGQYYSAAIDQPAPVEPIEPEGAPGDRPPEPELPPRPEEPADDETDPIVLSEFRDDFRAWEAEAQQVQDDYRRQLGAYEAEVKIFEAEFQGYITEKQDWAAEMQTYETARRGGVVAAERIIEETNVGFGWLFVDKNNAGAYWGTILTTWVAQLVIITILLIAILVLIKRKDST
jgi:hypothetical protein